MRLLHVMIMKFNLTLTPSMHVLQLTYDIPQSDILYNKTMTYCSECWRKFKINLTNNYIHAKVKDGEPRPTPCSKYSYIDEATWQEFFIYLYINCLYVLL